MTPGAPVGARACAPQPISVVIPCRDGAAFLPDAVRSALAQERAPLEVIVVDDGSEDGSGALAAELGARVIRHDQPRGNGAARNSGLRAARAPLVALLDADDEWLPEHLAVLAPLLEAHPTAGAAFSALRDFGESANPEAPPRIPWIDEGAPQWLFERCLRDYIGQPSACIVRRELALGIGGFDELLPVGVDFELWLRLARQAPFVATHRVTARYRRHPGQISAPVARQVEMCFRARHAAWESLRRGSDEEATARAAQIIREAWSAALERAWDDRRLGELRALLALDALVPGSAALRAQWRLRGSLPAPLVRLWSSLPGFVRRPLAPLFRSPARRSD